VTDGAPAFPTGWRFPAGTQAATAPQAMIASNAREASEAGIEILRAGGNAVDAAVAVGFALAVAHPEAGNLGGGGYMLVRMADGRTAALDYREVAPRTATRTMFLDRDGRGTEESVTGHRASGVPGAVAGMAAALARYGTLPLARVIAPALRLAEEGVVVDTALARSLAASQARIALYAGARTFFPGGRPPAVGSRLRQPALARTLRLLAARGPDAFYRGEIGDSLVAEMRRGQGLITKRDLAEYRPVWREPVRGTYRGHTVLGMPPSSSGGVSVIGLLNVLGQRPTPPPFGSTAQAHLLTEGLRRVFIDRNTRLGDPAFVQVPVAELTSADHARRLAASIDPTRATPTRALLPPGAGALREGNETTHYSVADAAGNVVATTTTINELYGSAVFVPGAGFFLNDEMDDFATAPGQPNVFGLVQGEQNAVAPGKRPLSAMSPTIVLDPQNRPLLVVGSRGGPRIITSTAQVILNVLDYRMSLADAMSAPRLHHQALPDTLRLEAGGLRAPVVDSLRAMGHAVSTGDFGFIGRVHAVMRVPGGWAGMVDPRTSGGAVGY
jgi:gamma-glutamyltranspeptidase/glutathione hydrolase